jgi:primosomal protein N' (replication factor Y)
VQIVDLAKVREMTPRDRRSALTPPLRKALGETLEAGGQAILFLNRRGFSTQIYCFDCGYGERCDSCDVALVYHAASDCLRCHYCDYHKPPPEKCGGCGATGTVLLGVGTERLEEEVQALFPEARIVRLDRDKSQRKGYTESVLRALRCGDANVLVGTQMVAKGHDFPGVRLVGVIAADQGLHMPDFRAAERSFQLLTQVAGRAGRAEEPGRVILQTFVPDHYAIEPVRNHDYERFYHTELEFRKALAYPPFGRITQVMLSAADEKTARDAAETLALQVRALAAPGDADPAAEGPAFEVLGPAPAPLARLRGRFRYQLLVKGRDSQRVRRASELLSEALRRLPREVQAALDADPVNML